MMSRNPENQKRQPGKYDDILYLSRPVSKRHPPMPLLDRAAQFAPFAALTGHEDAVREAARLTDTYIELDEEQREKLDQQLSLLLAAMHENPYSEPEVTITYFKPDEKKDGGAYIPVIGKVKKVDVHRRQIILSDETALPVDSIISIEGTVFDDMGESQI